MKDNLYISFLSLCIVLILVACGVSEGQTDMEPVKSTEDVTKDSVPSDTVSDIEGNLEADNEETVQNPETANKDFIIEQLEEMKVHFIDVGQADATLFEYSVAEEEYTILFDAGNWNRSDVLQYLKSQQIEEIDILIGSHPHADHIGQFDEIINHFNVGEVWLSGETTTSQTFLSTLEAIEANEVDYHEPRAGEVFDVGPLEITIINPEHLTGDLHESSISALFTYGETSFVLTGDAEEETEQAMLMRGISLDADVLQLGHHGSNTSTSQAFLNAINPKIAIVSAGADNQYGHPHDEVINRVTSVGIELFSTYVDGTIVIKSDGKNLNVSTNQEGNHNADSSNSKSETPKVEKQPELDQGSTNCIDINSASVEELQAIVHIGPARAEEILTLRPFSAVDGMTKVKGIAAGRLSDIISEGRACVK